MDILSNGMWANFIGALTYYFIMAITPGQNNILLANSGLNFGYAKTSKLIIAIVIGTNAIILISILGFTHIFNKYKIIHIIISCIGVLFLLYLGFKMATSKSTMNDTTKSKKSKPISLLAMIIFQFSNVKLIIVIIYITSIYHKSTMLKTYVFVSLITILPAVISANVWILFGSTLAHILKKPRTAQIFNIIMGLTLIIYSLYMIPIQDIRTMLHI